MMYLKCAYDWGVGQNTKELMQINPELYLSCWRIYTAQQSTIEYTFGMYQWLYVYIVIYV